METTDNKKTAKPNNKKWNKNHRKPKASGSDRKETVADAAQRPYGAKKNNDVKDALQKQDSKKTSRSQAPHSKGNKNNAYRNRDNHADDKDIRSYHNDYVAHFDVNEDYEDNIYLGDDGKYGRQVENSGIVVGRNAVRELLKSDRTIDKLLVRRGDREGSIVVLVAEAVSRGIPVVEADKAKLDALSGNAPHQGVIAMAAEKEYVSVDDILKIAEDRGEVPLIVIADGIVDPYNLGSLIRCAEGAGAHGLIIPKRRAVGLTPVVSKASAGAVEHLAIAKVPNIAATIDYLKKKGVWTYAAEAGGSAYYDTDFSGPAALVFGSEGDGIQEIVKKKCDFIVSIPMYGQVNSFNVSTAASVLLCEAARRHRT